MSYLLQLGVSIVVWGLLISAFVMSIVALTKKTYYNSVLVHPAGGNQNGKAPTVSVLASGFSSPAIFAGSTDSSGQVQVTASSTLGSVVVKFGTAYKVAPRAVVVSPTSGTPLASSLAVNDINTEGFVVYGQTASGTSIIGFTYIVL